MRNDTLPNFTLDGSASGLQNGKNVMVLKKWIVGLLAAAALTGCGVGVDDPEGQAAMGQTQQAVIALPASKTSETAVASGQSVTPSLTDPYLPQDPVPLSPVVRMIVGGPGNPDPTKK